MQASRHTPLLAAPILIVETGEPVAPLLRHGGFAHWIRLSAGLPRDAAVVHRADAAASLPEPSGFGAAIVTGSAAMVTDRHGWSEALAGWLRDADAAGLPLLGICYGHQLLAHAFGGTVGENPHGREMGSIAVETLPAAADDALFARAPARFVAQATHRQSVLALPAGAVPLARSAQDPHQAFRLGARCWGVQFHPEFSAAVMRGYIAARAAALREEGRDPAAMRAAVRAAPVPRRILRRFVHLATRVPSGAG